MDMGLTDDIQHKANETVVSCKWQQDLVYEQNMLEVVYYALPIEKVHSRPQKVPIQGSRKPQILSFTRYVCDGDDFLERHYLDAGDNRYEI